MASRVTLNWDFDSNIPHVTAEIQDASEDGLRDAAQYVVDHANVPTRSGALKRSGRVDMFYPVAVVSFGQTGKSDRGRDTRHYAIPQHQRFDYTHPRGGSPRFLERQISNGQRLFEIMGRRIRRAIEQER